MHSVRTGQSKREIIAGENSRRELGIRRSGGRTRFVHASAPTHQLIFVTSDLPDTFSQLGKLQRISISL
jgi:hypothetical protein